MDLTTGWNFRRNREAAIEYVRRAKPKLLIGSPMCSMFSALQNLSELPKEKEETWGEAREHIKFVVQLYRMQLKEGRVFIHEHPARASSWDLEEMKELMQEEHVYSAFADQCMYGLKTHGRTRDEIKSAKKPTRFLTNSWALKE